MELPPSEFQRPGPHAGEAKRLAGARPAAARQVRALRLTARRLPLVVALAFTLTACPAGSPGAVARGGKARPAATARGPQVDVAGKGGGLISDAGASIVGDAGASLISNNGGQLIGKVKIPSGIVANNSGSLISDQGGAIIANNGGGLIGDAGGSLIGDAGGSLIGKTKLRLLATADAPAAGFTVTLCDAGGTPFKDAAGKPFQATTDAAGSYTFARTPRGANLVARVDLPPAVGPMVAYVPDAEPGARREVDVDGTSTLVMGYVLETYVRPQAKPREVLAKLPARVEADTRARLAAAVGEQWPAKRFDAGAIRAAVGSLRARDAGVDGQFAYVKSLLVAGLADLGDGLEATKVSLTYPYAVASLSDGSLLIAERNADRIRRRWPDGTLTTFAGKAGARVLGDGGPAADAHLDRPYHVVVNAQDDVFVADFGNFRVRRIDGKTGVITTVIGSGEDPSGTEGANVLDGVPALEAKLNRPVAVALDAQGRVVVKGNNGTYRLEADGKLKGLGSDDENPPDALASGPDGTVYAYQHDSGFVSTLVGDAFKRLVAVPTHKMDEEGRLAVAPDGELYVAGKTQVWRWDRTAWRELALDFRHVTLKGLCADADGLLLADSDTNRIWRVPRAGGAGTQIAGLVPASGDEPVAPERLGLNRPTALAIDRQGNLYVADGLNNVVWKRRPDGLYVRFAGKPDVPADVPGPGAGLASQTPIAGVLAVAALGDGRVVIVEGSLQTLLHMREVTPDGMMKVLPFPTGVLFPFSLTPDADGSLLLTDIALRQVQRVKGQQAEALAPMFELEQPTGLVAAPDGTIYVADAGKHGVFRLAGGELTRVAGGNGEGLAGDGGAATAAKLNYPLGLALDAAGRLYVADSRNDRVRRIDLQTGTITTVVGPSGLALSGTAPDDSLKEPIGLVFDAEENLYISDSGHNQVKLVLRAALGP